jgi:hypothetical protein
MAKAKLTAKEQLSREIAKAKRERWEAMFLQQLAAILPVGWKRIYQFERQFQFDHVRKWKLDFAFKLLLLAVEIEGLQPPWLYSRHTTNKGFTEDCRKYAEAMLQGWTVGRFTGQMVQSGEAIRWTEKVLARLAS